MDIGVINTLIFNTIFKDAAAIASNGGYIMDECHYNLFDTDTLNGGSINSATPDKTEMMYTLDGCKNYVFVSLGGLNVINPANIVSVTATEATATEVTAIEAVTTSATTATATSATAKSLRQVIVLYSSASIHRIKEQVTTFERFTFFKNMYEEVSANIVIYEELFIKMEEQLLGDALTNANIEAMLVRIQTLMDETDDDLFLISKFADKFEIPKSIAKFNINLIKMAYSEYYVENCPFELYVDHIYKYILKLTVEEYVLLYSGGSGDSKVQYIADICYKEFLNLQDDIIQIGETCEFILYFIGKYKQLSKQTCGSLFGTYFGTAFRLSPIHIAKKKQLSDLINRVKLEQAKIKTQKQKNEGIKKLQMLKRLIGTIEEEIIYIKELYKLQFFTIIHAFIEYPLMVSYFKRKINTDNKDNLLYKLDSQLQKCTEKNYIELFPSLMDNFTTITKEDKKIGCSFITDIIYPNKKLEEIEISPKRGTIIENIIYSLYEIENTDPEIDTAKNIAFILYVAIYFYL